MGEEAARSREAVIKALRELAQRLLESGIGLRAAVLFGSYARGDELAESDVDVLVVADGFRGMKFFEREYLVLSLWKYHNIALEPWCYTPEEILEALNKANRLDVVDAYLYGMVVYGDGFWRGVKERFRERMFIKTRYGELVLR